MLSSVASIGLYTRYARAREKSKPTLSVVQQRSR
jgi:hypothetical protein